MTPKTGLRQSFKRDYWEHKEVSYFPSQLVPSVPTEFGDLQWPSRLPVHALFHSTSFSR